MHPHGDKEDFIHHAMGTLSIGYEVEVMVEEEEEEEVGQVRLPSREIQMEDEEELVMEMEEVGKCSREQLKITDQREIGQYQPM